MYHPIGKRHLSVASKNELSHDIVPSANNTRLPVTPAANVEIVAKVGGEKRQNNVMSLPVLPGQKLRQAREKRGVSQQEVATALNIPKRFVNALELDDYDSLPGQLYARGYMKNYCRYLNISSSDIISLFNDLVRDEKEPEGALSAEPAIGLAHKWRCLNIQWHLYALACCVAVMAVIWVWPMSLQDESSATVVGEYDEAALLRGQLPEESSLTYPLSKRPVEKNLFIETDSVGDVEQISEEHIPVGAIHRSS